MQLKSLPAVLGFLLTGTALLAAARITLVDNGKPAATIVIADQPTAIPIGKPGTVAYAAEELQRFIEKASGARLEVVPAAKAPATGTLLLVGRSALSEQHQLALPAKPEEGLRIISFPRGVAILGEIKPAGVGIIAHEVDRGTLVNGEPLESPPVISGRIRSWFAPPGSLRQNPQRSFTVNGEGECEGILQPTLLSSTYANGVWTVVVKCPAKALGIGALKAKAIEVQFERQRAARPKVLASEYYWVPPMRPPWQSHARFGRLD